MSIISSLYNDKRGCALANNYDNKLEANLLKKIFLKQGQDKTGMKFNLILDTDGLVIIALIMLFEGTEDYQAKMETNLKATINKSNAREIAILGLLPT